MTNDLGHKLAKSVGTPTTLGVYRGGNYVPWLPGATIDVWVPCARGEIATGVAPPHVYFVQTIGDRTSDSGSIHCLTCRAELAERRASGVAIPSKAAPSPVASTAPRAAPAVSASQSKLPF